MNFIKGLFVFVATIGFTQGFVPEIQMPYKAISGTSITEINKIGSTLTCDEQRNYIQDCATECFDRSLISTGCAGFYTDATQSNICYLCHVSNTTEIQANSHTVFGSNDKLYLLKQKPVTPEVSMNFDNYTEAEIYGVNVVGTPTGVGPTDYTPGIKGEGLYIHDGSKVALTGSGTECWTNLDHCTSGMTASIWHRTLSSAGHTYPVGSGVGGEKGFNFLLNANTGLVPFKVFGSTRGYESTYPHSLSINEWYLLTGVYDGNEHVDFYVNGVEANITETGVRTSVDSDWRAHIGVRDISPYNQFPLNGYVDEFKYYYRMLNSVEIWREYVGYDIDLDLPSVVPHPDLVSNGNDCTKLIDGNLATCILSNTTPRTPDLKVKLWNSASDKTNYSVTVVTENLECDHKGFSGLMVYGNQHDLPTNKGFKNEDRMHFLGHFNMMALETEFKNNEQNECVFRHICEDMCYYVFISVQNVPDEGSWKICEVTFN